MFSQLRAHLPHYFSRHVSRQFVSLTWSVGLRNFALAAVIIFEPMYLITLGYSLVEVMLFYCAIYVIYFIILPLSIRILSRVGVEHAIFYSHFFLIGYFLALFGASYIPELIFLAPLIFAVQKLFYWPAFHVDFMLFSDEGQQGREMGALLSVNSI